MLNINKISQLNELNSLKEAYFRASTSPLDGMWHFGFVPMADHYGFYGNDDLVVFCCFNSDMTGQKLHINLALVISLI